MRSGLGRQHMRTEGERMREFVAYVRMMGAQRGALQSTVEDFADDHLLANADQGRITVAMRF